MSTNVVFFFYPEESLSELMKIKGIPPADHFKFHYVQPLQPVRFYEGYIFIDWFGLVKVESGDDATLVKVQDVSGYTEKRGTTDVFYSMYNHGVYGPVRDQVVPYSRILRNFITEEQVKTGYIVDSIGISESGTFDFTSMIVNKDSLGAVYLITKVVNGTPERTILVPDLERVDSTFRGFSSGKVPVFKLNMLEAVSKSQVIEDVNDPSLSQLPGLSHLKESTGFLQSFNASKMGIVLGIIISLLIMSNFFMVRKIVNLESKTLDKKYPTVEWLQREVSYNSILYTDLQRIYQILQQHSTRYRLLDFEVAELMSGYEIKLTLAWLPISQPQDAVVLANAIKGTVVEEESMYKQYTVIRKELNFLALNRRPGVTSTGGTR